MAHEPPHLPPSPLLQAALFSAPIERLMRCATQPRQRFDDDALDELAASLVAVGMLEPILVRQSRQTGHYEIVAGERRWRAAQRAGLREVPVIVRELSDEAAFEAALIENLQREDLSPIETARAYERMLSKPGATLESVAARVGRKHFSSISNTVRLLKLPAQVQGLIEDRALTEGHGRALLGLSPDDAAIQRVALEAIKLGWSVRKTEKRVRELGAGGRAKAGKSANVRALEERLARAINAPVEVQDEGGSGSLSIRYSSYEELDRLIDEVLLARELGPIRFKR